MLNEVLTRLAHITSFTPHSGFVVLLMRVRNVGRLDGRFQRQVDFTVVAICQARVRVVEKVRVDGLVNETIDDTRLILTILYSNVR